MVGGVWISDHRRSEPGNDWWLWSVNEEKKEGNGRRSGEVAAAACRGQREWTSRIYMRWQERGERETRDGA